VLSEEDFQRNLNEVIQRQFFPDLVDLQTAVTLQQRREARDVAGAAAVRRAARQLKEHEEFVREHEEEQDSRGALLRSEPRPLHLETLTGFHARVTSEDNAEFEQVQSEELRQAQIERSKMLLLTNSENGSRDDPQSRLLLPGAQTPLFLASDAFDAPSNAPNAAKATAAAENSLFFVPALKSNPADEPQEDSNRMLMPPPSSSAPVASFSALVEYVPKLQLEKRIEPACTRFPAPPRIPAARARSHHLEADGDASSTSAVSDTDAETDLDHDSVAGDVSRLSRLRRQGQKRKARELQTPVPIESPAFADRISTSSVGDHAFGAVESTRPQHQNFDDDGDDEGSDNGLNRPEGSSKMAFRLPPTSRREAAAERAHEILQERSRRARGQGGGAPQTDSSSASSLASMLLPTSSSTRSVSDGRRSSARSSSRSALGTALRAAYGGGPGGGSLSGSVIRGSSSSVSRTSGGGGGGSSSRRPATATSRSHHHFST
jgi:hypothetical protein